MSILSKFGMVLQLQNLCIGKHLLRMWSKKMRHLHSDKHKKVLSAVVQAETLFLPMLFYTAIDIVKKEKKTHICTYVHVTMYKKLITDADRPLLVFLKPVL